VEISPTSFYAEFICIELARDLKRDEPASITREKMTMATQTQAHTGPEHDHALEEKIKQFRELFADAPEIGKKALENALHELKSQASDLPPAVESAGRVGARLGKVSELTIIVPLAPGGAKRLRAFLRLLRGNLSQGADKVGTLHTMRFVFFDNDTRLLFATAYDGDWDAYIDDFVAKIPDYLDIIDSAWEGWPGIRSPDAKDYLAKDHGGRLVHLAPGSDCGRDHPAEAHRQGGRRIPRQDWLAGGPDRFSLEDPGRSRASWGIEEQR
jgi:hypothetical protein